MTIPFLDQDPTARLSAFADILDTLPRQPIRNDSWPAFTTSCTAWFSIAYTPQAFVLKYTIENDFFKSIPRAINEDVHLDNCIEFFVQFDDDPRYYNIEFNCLGNGKMAYGLTGDRQLLSPAAVTNISTWSRLAQTGDRFDWEMVLMIPTTSFEYHDLRLNKDLLCRANFYKCGDHLPEPHFLTWSKVNADTPNFHVPAAFQPIHLGN